MAKQMSYTDPATGAEYPQSVWLPMFEAADFTPRAMGVVFNGYASPIALATGKAPVGQRRYDIRGDDMLALVMQDYPGASIFERVSNCCYALASQTLDTPAPTEADPGRKVSFFAGATDIAVSLV